MGRDKALLPVAGTPLAVSVSAALVAAGARDVFCVGGDAPALTALGLEVIPDSTPGQGPLGGLVAALGSAQEDLVAVLACDLPWVSAAGVRLVVQALAAAPDAAWAAPRQHGRWQHLHGAYRRASHDAWAQAFAAGERSVHRAAARLAGIEVVGVAPSSLDDADWPTELPADH